MRSAFAKLLAGGLVASLGMFAVNTITSQVTAAAQSVGDNVTTYAESTSISQAKAKEVYTALQGVTGWSSLWDSATYGHPTKFVIYRDAGAWKVYIANEKFVPASVAAIPAGSRIYQLESGKDASLND